MNAADLFVKCLETEGVRYVFGIPGEETLELNEALERSSKISFIPFRHEQGAAFAADVYGRLTGKPGVCLATLGPGATNLITGVADANMDRAPLVAITGQKSLSASHKEFHQYIDVPQVFRAVTKWTQRILAPDTVPEVVRKAFRVAVLEKPGATHIELSEDVASAPTKGVPLRPAPKLSFRASDKERREALAILDAAKRPLILAGNGVIRSGASKELVAFAEKTNIPVANTFMAKGAFPSDHPLHVSTLGLQSKDYLTCGFDHADLVITIGYDLVEYAPSLWNPLKDKKILCIDSVPSDVDAHYNFDLELVGNIPYVLSKLTQETSYQNGDDYALGLKKLMAEEKRAVGSDADFPLKPQRIIADMRSALGRSDILISDVGAHKLWIGRLYSAYEPNTCIISNGFASMGIALPGAIGAKLAFPEKKVVAAMGDGCFLMNSQELETAVRLGLSFVVVIWSDSEYGAISWHQQKRGFAPSGISFTNPDFVKYAESFGCKGVRIQRAAEFLPALRTALADEGVTVIEVPVDYAENMKLTEKLGQNVCPV
ncbi:MAG: acetolactate synthase large subunit [Candidatus Micrarchaeota archaeon]|nr:acetolactate synthase large subunit [Candidatus Micrarchaeota archaeon]